MSELGIWQRMEDGKSCSVGVEVNGFHPTVQDFQTAQWLQSFCVYAHGGICKPWDLAKAVRVLENFIFAGSVSEPTRLPSIFLHSF